MLPSMAITSSTMPPSHAAVPIIDTDACGSVDVVVDAGGLGTCASYGVDVILTLLKREQ
jgi:hypothetical protein